MLLRWFDIKKRCLREGAFYRGGFMERGCYKEGAFDRGGIASSWPGQLWYHSLHSFLFLTEL